MKRFEQEMSHPLKNQIGISLVELLLVVGLMGFVALGMSSLFFNLQKESRSLKEKLATLELEKDLLNTISGDQLCSFTLTSSTVIHPVINPQSFNSTTLPATNLQLSRIPLTIVPGAPNLIQVGQPVAPDVPSLTVETIQLTNFLPTGSPTAYMASLEVRFNGANLVRGLRPISTILTLQTTAPDGAGNVTVTGCGSASSGTGYLVQNQACTASCSYTNTQTKPVFISQQGGASNPCSGQNSYELRARVGGVTVAQAHTAGPIGSKSGYLSFFLDPGATVLMTSSPWACSFGGPPTGPFVYSVYRF